MEPSLKRDAENILRDLGLPASQAVTLFYRQLVLQKGLPFEVKLPVAVTRKALEDAVNGRNLTSYTNIDNLFEDAEKGTKQMSPNEYPIVSHGYYKRGLMNLRVFERVQAKANLIYAALEFRNCIERVLAEYWALILIDDSGKFQESLYRAKDLKRKILEGDPDFIKKLEFCNLHLQALNFPDSIHIPDLDLLSKLYGQMGNYVHAPKRPEETVENPAWWGKLIKLLNEAESYLGEILSHPLGHFKLNESGWALFERLKSNQMTEEQVVNEIRSAAPGNNN